MSDPACVVCGRPIAKVTRYWEIRKPQPASAFAAALGGGGEAREDGDRYSSSTWWTTLWIDEARWPRTREECQRLANHPVRSIRRWPDGRAMGFTTWDGESYRDRFFCTNRCAQRQGYASAEAGARFVWKGE